MVSVRLGWLSLRNTSGQVIVISLSEVYRVVNNTYRRSNDHPNRYMYLISANWFVTDHGGRIGNYREPSPAWLIKVVACGCTGYRLIPVAVKSCVARSMGCGLRWNTYTLRMD